jgi:hypothetical protein
MKWILAEAAGIWQAINALASERCGLGYRPLAY